jgi:hypothetical protein
MLCFFKDDNYKLVNDVKKNLIVKFREECFVGFVNPV